MHVQTVRLLSISAILLGAVTLSSHASAKCPTSPTATLEDFSPYKFEPQKSHLKQLDKIAGEIERTLRTHRIKRIKIVGHAAEYGKSNFAKTARNRALVVRAELESRLDDKGIEYGKLGLSSSGESTHCPVASNSTKAGRAKNRRVEVWIVKGKKLATKKPRLLAKPTGLPLVTDKALKEARRARNPYTQCLANHLLDSSADHDVLDIVGLNTYMTAKIQDVGSAIHVFERDLRAALERRVGRINETKSSKSRQARFDAALVDQKNDVFRAIEELLHLPCDDGRTPVVRKYFLKETKRKKSLFSCPALKKRIETNIEEVGIRGCKS